MNCCKCDKSHLILLGFFCRFYLGIFPGDGLPHVPLKHFFRFFFEKNFSIFFERFAAFKTRTTPWNASRTQIRRGSTFRALPDLKLAAPYFVSRHLPRPRLIDSHSSSVRKQQICPGPCVASCEKIAPSKATPQRITPHRYAPRRFAPRRFASLRFAPRRSLIFPSPMSIAHLPFCSANFWHSVTALYKEHTICQQKTHFFSVTFFVLVVKYGA